MKEDLLTRLSELRSTLRVEKDLLSLIEEVERVLNSEDLTNLEREGFTLIKGYLKEAALLELRGLPRTSYINKVREIASILMKIDEFKGRGARMISLDDLVVVGEVDGKMIYSIKRDEGGSSTDKR